MDSRALSVVAPLLSLALTATFTTTAHAQGYPYAQPIYVPAPPPAAAPPPAQYGQPYGQPYGPQAPARPAGFDPFAGRFLRGYLGTSAFASFVLGQSGGAEALGPGAGYSIYGGLDFGRVVGVQLSYASSSHNPDGGCDPYYGECYPSYLSLEMMTADLRLHLPTGTHFRPFVQGGVGVAWLGRGGYLSDAVGVGFDAGGGFEYYLGRYVTVGATALYRGVRMSDYAVDTGGETTLGLLTVEGSLALHF